MPQAVPDTRPIRAAGLAPVPAMGQGYLLGLRSRTRLLGCTAITGRAIRWRSLGTVVARGTVGRLLLLTDRIACQTTQAGANGGTRQGATTLIANHGPSHCPKGRTRCGIGGGWATPQSSRIVAVGIIGTTSKQHNQRAECKEFFHRNTPSSYPGSRAVVLSSFHTRIKPRKSIGVEQAKYMNCREMATLARNKRSHALSILTQILGAIYGNF